MVNKPQETAELKASDCSPTHELHIPPTPNSTSLSFDSVMQSKNNSRIFS
jgi:hypothetical protein